MRCLQDCTACCRAQVWCRRLLQLGSVNQLGKRAEIQRAGRDHGAGAYGRCRLSRVAVGYWRVLGCGLSVCGRCQRRALLTYAKFFAVVSACQPQAGQVRRVFVTGVRRKSAGNRIHGSYGCRGICRCCCSKLIAAKAGIRFARLFCWEQGFEQLRSWSAFPVTPCTGRALGWGWAEPGKREIAVRLALLRGINHSHKAQTVYGVPRSMLQSWAR